MGAGEKAPSWMAWGLVTVSLPLAFLLIAYSAGVYIAHWSLVVFLVLPIVFLLLSQELGVERRTPAPEPAGSGTLTP
jgi:hypothetical protein